MKQRVGWLSQTCWLIKREQQAEQEYVLQSNPHRRVSLGTALLKDGDVSQPHRLTYASLLQAPFRLGQECESETDGLHRRVHGSTVRDPFQHSPSNPQLMPVSQ